MVEEQLRMGISNINGNFSEEVLNRTLINLSAYLCV
jgi:hypothetical protein